MHQGSVELEADSVDGILQEDLATEPDRIGPLDPGRLHLGQEVLDRPHAVGLLELIANGCVQGVPADDGPEVLLERRRLVEEVQPHHATPRHAHDADLARSRRDPIELRRMVRLDPLLEIIECGGVREGLVPDLESLDFVPDLPLVG